MGKPIGIGGGVLIGDGLISFINLQKIERVYHVDMASGAPRTPAR